jgi:hypothetical protein
MTLVTSSKQTHTWEDGYIYYILSPATGANDVVVTIGSAGENANVIIGAADYSNHNGSDPVGNFKGTASSATAVNTGSISYTDGDVIVAITVNAWINEKTVSWTNATEWFDETYSAMGAAGAAYTATGSGSVTITATYSSTGTRILITAARISPVSAVPTIESVSQISPGTLVNVVMSGYASAPLTANCSLNGVGITLEAGATTTACSFYAPAESAYLFGGARASHRFNTNVTLTIANGTDTDNHTVQVVPASSDQLAARSADALVNPIDSYNGGLTVATSDDVYQYSDPADAFTPFPATNDFTALEPAFNLYTKFYDVSASSWSSLTTTVFPAAAPPGGGTLSITATRVALNPPGSPGPADVNLTSFGGLDWLHTARLTTETYDSKSGGTMIGAPANIGTPAWARGEGDSLGHPLMTWTGGDPLATGTGYRFYDRTTVNGTGKRFTISPAGALVKIYLWAGGYNATRFDVDVSFSDASATAVNDTHTTSSNVFEYYRYEITAQPAGGAATIQVDLTKVSGSGDFTWQAIAVESGTPTATYSLTSSDTTVTPGQTVTATLAGGPFQGAITAAYAVYGVHEIPLGWAVLTPTTTSITAPGLSAFSEGQHGEFLPWYANWTLRIVAGDESADSPNTNQIVPPIAGDYGTVVAPPWVYSVSGAQEADSAYIHVVTGAGTATPESFDFTESEDTIVHIYCFNVASASWLARRVAQLPNNWVNTDQIVTGLVKRLVKSTVKVIA